MEIGSSQQGVAENERQRKTFETKVVQIVHKHFYRENSQAVEQVTQKGCATSILGGFEDPTGKSPEQPFLTSELILL